MNETERFEAWKKQIEKEIEDKQKLVDDVYNVLSTKFDGRLIVVGAKLYQEVEHLKNILSEAELIRSISHDNK